VTKEAAPKQCLFHTGGNRPRGSCSCLSLEICPRLDEPTSRKTAPAPEIFDCVRLSELKELGPHAVPAGNGGSGFRPKPCARIIMMSSHQRSALQRGAPNSPCTAKRCLRRVGSGPANRRCSPDSEQSISKRWFDDPRQLHGMKEIHCTMRNVPAAERCGRPERCWFLFFWAALPRTNTLAR
jgi:hypothetical protein